MQTQVGTFKNTPIKRNDLKSKSDIHDRYFQKFWRYFWTFEILSTSHFWTQMSSNIGSWQPTSEIASNNKKKVSRRNTKELIESR